VNEEEWGSLVARLERQAEANPDRYARKVLLFGLLGYAVLGLALLLLVGLAVGIGFLALRSSLLLGKAIIPLAGLAWVILRALKIRLDPPEGFPVSRSEAPALIEMIEDVGRRVRGPSLHQILVDGDFNASVVQIPRGLGLLGQRNYLVLGLPYMQATSPDEFRAVVAHELGHLSRNHGRISSWIYRIHATWQSLLAALEERRRLGTALFRRFFSWYQPRFEAYSFPLRRLHEYDADRAAADAAGAEPAASSLVAAVLNGSYLDTEYWPRVYARANEEPVPPPGVFRALPEGLANARKHPRADTWIANALARPTAPQDTHPSIGARIERLGFEPQGDRTEGDDHAQRFQCSRRFPRRHSKCRGGLHRREVAVGSAFAMGRATPPGRAGARTARDAGGTGEDIGAVVRGGRRALCAHGGRFRRRSGLATLGGASAPSAE
jgi:Zn-dependent protease with chaperone function